MARNFQFLKSLAFLKRLFVGACLPKSLTGNACGKSEFFYFLKLLIKPETADISQPAPIIINAIFHPILLSNIKINVYRANRLIGIAIPYNTKLNFCLFSLSMILPHSEQVVFYTDDIGNSYTVSKTHAFSKPSRTAPAMRPGVSALPTRKVVSPAFSN